MKTKLKYLKYIEKFLSGNMSKLEKEHFQEEMKKNKTLADEFREYTQLINSIKDKELLDFHKTLRKTFKKWKQKNQGFLQRYLSNKYWMAAAAAITILLISGLTAIIIEVTTAPEKTDLFAQDSTFLQETDSLNKMIIPEEQNQIAVENKDKEESFPEEQLAIETKIDFSQDKYKISPLYKELLHNNMRSGQFQLINPTDSIIIKKGEIIQIDFNGDYPYINLDILNHKGLLKKSLQNIPTGYQFQNDLPPGAYLLRFQTNEEPLWWGIVFTNGGN